MPGFENKSPRGGEQKIYSPDGGAAGDRVRHRRPGAEPARHGQRSAAGGYHHGGYPSGRRHGDPRGTSGRPARDRGSCPESAGFHRSAAGDARDGRRPARFEGRGLAPAPERGAALAPEDRFLTCGYPAHLHRREEFGAELER